MAEVTKFQEMNGCSGCMHAAEADPAGKPASVYGKGFWCKPLARAVDSRDGSHCDQWAYEA